MKYDYSRLTIDQIHEMLQWIVDRKRYRLKCNKPVCSEDEMTEHYLLAELGKRERLTNA